MTKTRRDMPDGVLFAVGALLDAMPECCCLTSHTGHVVHSNALMQRLLHSARGRALSAVLREVRQALNVPRPRGGQRHSRVAIVDGVEFVVHGCIVSIAPTLQSPFTLVSVRSSARAATEESGLKSRFELSTREIEVAALLACGLRNDVIAERLRVSPFTVRRHTERVLAKLGVRTRSEAAAVLARLGVSDEHARRG